MRVDSRSVRLILAAIFILIVVVSLTLYFASKPWRARVFFFPERKTSALVGERRFLPPRRGLAGNLTLYIQELLLGPSDPLLSPVVPNDVELQSVIDRQGIVYVSLSRQIIDLSADATLSIDETIQAIGNGVLYNFPKVRQLFILIEGQLPGEKYADGLVFDKNLLK